MWPLYRKVYVSHQMYFGVVTRILNINWNNFLGLFVEGTKLSYSFALAEVFNKMDGCPNKFSSHFLLPKITASNNLYHKFLLLEFLRILLLDLKNWMFENFNYPKVLIRYIYVSHRNCEMYVRQLRVEK